MSFFFTYHHTTRAAALAAIDRTKAEGGFDRALLWDFGRMGVITRFYSLHKPLRLQNERICAYTLRTMQHPNNSSYTADLSDRKAEYYALNHFAAGARAAERGARRTEQGV